MNRYIPGKQATRDGETLSRAMRALEESTGVRAELVEQEPGAADYEIEVRAPGRNKKKARTFFVEIKRSLTQAGLGEVFMQSRQIGKKFVLVSEYIPSAEADVLRDLDIAFFDTVGNAYFNDQELYVYVNAKKRAILKDRSIEEKMIEKVSVEEADDLRPSDLRILFALLSEPGLEKEDYRTIAAEANVALGTVAQHVTRLKDAGFLEESEKAGRKLTRKPQLFKLWVEGYIKKLRPKLLFARFEKEPAGGRWWHDVDIERFQAAWGGETGAEKLTGYLKPQIVTIYAENVLPRLQAQYGLRRRPEGDIEILRKFWGFKTENGVAPPLIVYADLVAGGDSRNLETAKMIYDRYLDGLVGEGAG